MAETLLDAALKYAELGLAVFPLAEGTKIPCIQGGFTQATTDVEQIKLFWSMRPNCNIGIATGGMSNGLVVVDVDLDNDKGEDGYIALHEWEEEHGELPEGACVTTPRGGMHLYFISDEPFSCSTNKEKGIDVRADGGFVVAPPSVRDDGRSYEWDLHIEDYGIPLADSNTKAFIAKMQEGKVESKRFELPERIESGERNVTLYKYACSLQAHSVPDDVIVASVMSVNRTLCDEPVDDDECERLVRSALAKNKGFSDKVKESKRNVYRALDCNNKGVPYQTITNCMAVLTNDIRLMGRFGYNEVAYTKTIECPVPWDRSVGTRQISDVDYSQFAAFLEKEYGLHSKLKAIDAIANVCSQNRYNPIAEWLEGLEWDGESRIGGLLPLCLGCAETRYNTEVMRLFMRGAVARVHEPGCQFDDMIVLVGGQGIGKSTFLRKLAHKSSWFDGNFNTIEGDAAVERLRGKWILEMAELLSLKRAQEVEAVKSFVTNRVDSIRAKYAKETEDRPRTCVFAGTTNNLDFLSDPTGNRRFLPIHCDAKEPQEFLFSDEAQDFIDQCWAEAYHDWKSGNRLLDLPPDLKVVAKDMQEQHTEDDPRVGHIQKYVDAQIQHADHLCNINFCVPEILEKALEVRDYKTVAIKLVREIHTIMQTSIQGIKPYENSRGRKLTKDYGLQKVYVPDEESDRVERLRLKLSLD